MIHVILLVHIFGFGTGTGSGFSVFGILSVASSGRRHLWYSDFRTVPTVQSEGSMIGDSVPICACRDRWDVPTYCHIWIRGYWIGEGMIKWMSTYLPTYLVRDGRIGPLHERPSPSSPTPGYLPTHRVEAATYLVQIERQSSLPIILRISRPLHTEYSGAMVIERGMLLPLLLLCCAMLPYVISCPHPVLLLSRLLPPGRCQTMTVQSDPTSLPSPDPWSRSCRCRSQTCPARPRCCGRACALPACLPPPLLRPCWPSGPDRP